MINNVSDLKSQLNDNFSYGDTVRFTKMKLKVMFSIFILYGSKKLIKFVVIH
jgi:hypothetical protein